jgi:peptidoglycan/xylan/chitin deacetylase (PgdA/CDA1 family)
MYHYVRDLKISRYPNIKGLDKDLFNKQILYLKENFNIVTLEDVQSAFENNSDLPEKAILLTFDDGYIDHFTTVFPVLDKHGIQGSFFIPGKAFVENTLLDVNKIHYILASASVDKLMEDTLDKLDYYRGDEFSFPSNDELIKKYCKESRYDNPKTIFVKRVLQTAIPERLRNIISSELFAKYFDISEQTLARELYMDYDQIMCMINHGMHIGLHGYDHYWLENLSRDKVKEDTEMALSSMKDFINTDSWTMVYPYGSHSESVTDVIKQLGCTAAFTSKVDTIRAENCNDYTRFTIPRLDTNDFPPKSNNYKEYINYDG